jgi:hypothetical protein
MTVDPVGCRIGLRRGALAADRTLTLVDVGSLRR